MADNPLIYLTGAPATGKSSVAQFLCENHGARTFSYGQALRDHASMGGISHEDLRDRSADVVSPELIAELDANLPKILAAWLADGPVVIDSHAVTSETWGLRALPYSPERLAALSVSHIVCLIADGRTLLDRIETSPEGRRSDDTWKLEQLNGLQLAFSAAYAHTLGIGLQAVDARSPQDAVCREVAARCGLTAGGHDAPIGE